MRISIYTDGAARGNPGPSASGYAIYKGRQALHGHSEYNGRATNNYAEYRAIILALEWCASNLQGQEPEMELYSDSELVIRQINGSYKIKSTSLKPLNEKVRSLVKKLKGIKFYNVSREDRRISKVDKSLNLLLDNIKN